MKIAVIIPAYRCKKHISDVLNKIPAEVASIYVIDDACPEGTGKFVESTTTDARVKVLFREINGGVGAAVKTGFDAGIADGADVLVKIDGDGQMNPELLHKFIGPLKSGIADYAKGNRFYRVSDLRKMPRLRLFGNSVLSFFSKIATGYWQVMDPTNGYFAIHRVVLEICEYEKLADRFFFETDMLFRLNLVRAKVIDIPITAVYGDERSTLRISRVLLTFPWLYSGRFLKRIIYSYFLRDFSIASLEFVAGLSLFGFGIIFGALHWARSLSMGVASPPGTVMLAALPILIGFQLLLSFLSYDVANTPNQPINRLIRPTKDDNIEGIE
jgi:glycosyltransferase involved in cell wall biosynthesis